MEAEQILENSAKRNMVQWSQEDFKKSHPKLYKTIIEAINEALIIDDVSVSVKTLLEKANSLYELAKQAPSEREELILSSKALICRELVNEVLNEL